MWANGFPLKEPVFFTVYWGCMESCYPQYPYNYKRDNITEKSVDHQKTLCWLYRLKEITAFWPKPEITFSPLLFGTVILANTRCCPKLARDIFTKNYKKKICSSSRQFFFSWQLMHHWMPLNNVWSASRVAIFGAASAWSLQAQFGLRCQTTQLDKGVWVEYCGLLVRCLSIPTRINCYLFDNLTVTGTVFFFTTGSNTVEIFA